jgi:hypothetical protein
MLNRWIPRRAQSTARFILSRGRPILKYFWVPANPDAADIFVDFHLASVAYPAMRAGFQGFAPHLLHRYILPAWRRRYEKGFGMKGKALKRLRSFAPYLSHGLYAYFRWVIIARILESGQFVLYPFATIDGLMEDIRLFMTDLGFSWTDLLIPYDTYTDQSNFRFCEGILAVCRHWEMDEAAVRRHFPVQYLCDRTSLEGQARVNPSVVIEFEEILDSMTFSDAQYRQLRPYPRPFLPFHLASAV